jgi:hypothetical protein
MKNENKNFVILSAKVLHHMHDKSDKILKDHIKYLTLFSSVHVFYVCRILFLFAPLKSV